MSDLPPLEEPQAYVVVGPDDQRGPYTMELLIGEVLAGRLSDATPVWWPGLADWTTMGGHPALAAEIQRRRTATTDSAPGWVDPNATTSAPQPTYEQHPYQQAAPEQSYGQDSWGGSGQDQGAYGQQTYEPQSHDQQTYGQQGYEPQTYEQQGYGEPEPSPQAFDPASPQPAEYGDQPSPFGTSSYDSQQVVYDQAAAQQRDLPHTFGTGGGDAVRHDNVSARTEAWHTSGEGPRRARQASARTVSRSRVRAARTTSGSVVGHRGGMERARNVP